MNILEEANNIINNIPIDNSWGVFEYDNFKLVVDMIILTPSHMILKDGRQFKIIPDRNV